VRFSNASIARRVRLRDLSTDSLRWTMGFFCGLVGAFILVAPHHFGAPVYAALRPYSPWWGTLSLTAGVALIAVEILRPRRWVVLLVHGLLGAALLALAASFAQVQGWTGLISYTILGLGTIFAGLRPRTRVPPGESGDLFAFLMGMLATMAGAFQTLVPGLFENPYYDPVRPFLLPMGLGLLLTGPLLCLAQLRPPLSRGRSAAIIHLADGLVFVSYGIFTSIPLRAWTGISLYLGCGTVVALLPWLRRRLARLDTAALRTRFGLALGMATSLSLILATAIVTHQEERLAEEQAREALRIEAEAIARNVDDYVELSGARTYAVAALAGRMAMTEPAQRELLLGSRQAYPDVAAFRTLDGRGAVVAGVGRVRLPPRLLREMAEEMRQKPRVQLQLVRIEESSLLLMTAPVQRQPGALGGQIVAVFDSKWLARRIVRPGSNVHLGDGRGHLIAHQDAAVGLPELPPGWDRRVRAGAGLHTEDGIVSTARVPDLEWIVAVERSRADALSGVRRGRDTAFLLLLLVVPLAVAGGIATARRIARPLGTLADAVDQMAAGNPGAPLGSSGITEVARLSSAFREMRDRLAARTRERERLAEELRARADALAESDRRKDEFLAMLAHELRNPLGAISNASYLMEQLGPTDPQMVRSVSIVRRQVLHLVRLVDDLLDVSRITRGKVELRRERIDLREVMRHAVEMTRPLFDQRSHELRVELPEEPLTLEADATRLEQVLANLLRNAAKYTEPAGLIDLAVCRDGTAALVSVRDNGIGIAPDLLPRVFELFAQGEQSLDRSGAGLGIGLTLVRSLVEMHGGSVEARSDGVGKGAEFTVRLPLAL
jgi:signal transduction histidine kinase